MPILREFQDAAQVKLVHAVPGDLFAVEVDHRDVIVMPLVLQEFHAAVEVRKIRASAAPHLQ